MIISVFFPYYGIFPFFVRLLNVFVAPFIMNVLSVICVTSAEFLQICVEYTVDCVHGY